MLRSNEFDYSCSPSSGTVRTGSSSIVGQSVSTGNGAECGLPAEPRTGSTVTSYPPVSRLPPNLGPVPFTASFPYAKSQAENLQAPAAAVPVLVPKDGVGIVSALHRGPGQSLMFRSVGLGRPHEIPLRSFAELHYHYDNVYWDVIAEADGLNS